MSKEKTRKSVCRYCGLTHIGNTLNSACNYNEVKLNDQLVEALKEAVEDVEDLRKFANNNGAEIDNETCGYGREALKDAGEGKK